MSYLRSFLPWIVVTVLTGTIDLRYAVLAGLATALVLISAARRGGRGWDAIVIECSAAVFLAAYAVAVFAAPHQTLVQDYGSAASSLWLALTAWVSLAVGRPFTLGIARTTVPEEHWNSPLFIRVNNVITAVWAAAFTLSGAANALLHHYAPDNGTARTLVAVAGFVLPVLFTVRYPEAARARHQSNAAAAK
ncbi:hypothetical protein ACWCP6_02895 [Streptomyces sp. NPDC002004]